MVEDLLHSSGPNTKVSLCITINILESLWFIKVNFSRLAQPSKKRFMNYLLNSVKLSQQSQMNTSLKSVNFFKNLIGLYFLISLLYILFLLNWLDDALLSVGNEVFNAPIDEAAALQLINELYRNDGDAEHILVGSITFSDKALWLEDRSLWKKKCFTGSLFQKSSWRYYIFTVPFWGNIHCSTHSSWVSRAQLWCQGL